LELTRRENDRLELLVGSRTEQVDQLQDQLDDLRDWSNGGSNGVAVPSLVAILTDNGASVRQKIKAASAILGYKVQDPSVSAFARRFLESICAKADVPTDYKIQAAETLRRAEGDAQLRPTIERLTPPAAPIDREAEAAAIRAQNERRRAHVEKMTAQIAAEYGYTPPIERN
jgi:hypothetical protein